MKGLIDRDSGMTLNRLLERVMDRSQPGRLILTAPGGDAVATLEIGSDEIKEIHFGEMTGDAALHAIQARGTWAYEYQTQNSAAPASTAVRAIRLTAPVGRPVPPRPTFISPFAENDSTPAPGERPRPSGGPRLKPRIIPIGILEPAAAKPPQAAPDTTQASPEPELEPTSAPTTAPEPVSEAGTEALAVPGEIPSPATQDADITPTVPQTQVNPAVLPASLTESTPAGPTRLSMTQPVPAPGSHSSPVPAPMGIAALAFAFGAEGFAPADYPADEQEFLRIDFAFLQHQARLIGQGLGLTTLRGLAYAEDQGARAVAYRPLRGAAFHGLVAEEPANAVQMLAALNSPHS
jgi:hypothetical protein